MYPDRRKALELLYEAHTHNEGAWLGHSLTCAHCAERIAYYSQMDPDKAYVLGLLHDIGRKFGKRHLGHVSDGYSYMMSLGYDDVARICLSHSFNDKDLNAYVGNFDTSEEETKLIREKLEEAVFDDYDLLIQLCDAMAGSEGVMNIKERMSDVKRRYGDYDQKKWDKNIALKAYFEKKMGRDIYEAVGKEQYRNHDLYLKEEPICVIGHSNPDSDAVCSMIACSELLDRIGISAKPVISTKLNRESEYALSVLGVEAPELIDEIKGKKVFLVDHNDPVQSSFAIAADDVIGIIDHHVDSDTVKEDLFIRVIELIGSTATLVYRLYREKGIDVSKQTAGLLLTGLLSDTRNMTVNVKREDVFAYEKLIGICGIRNFDAYYRKMRKAYMDHEGMSDEEIFLSDYKEYACGDTVYGIAVVAAENEKKQKKIAERMQKVMEDRYGKGKADILFTKIKNEEAGSMYLCGYGKDADEILAYLSKKKDGKNHLFGKSLSRKKHLVPKINVWISEHRKNENE